MDSFNERVALHCFNNPTFWIGILSIVAKNIKGVGTIVTQILSAIFAIDILFNCISCHVDEHNILLHTFDKIIPYYIKGWFLIDIISIIPFE